MLESIGSVLLGLALLCACGALLYGYVAWRTKQREADERQEALRSGGGGGPKEQA